MKQKELLSNVKSDLNKMSDCVQSKIKVYEETRINMQQNLEPLLASLEELKNHINILQKDIKREDNIFFIGTANQENNNNKLQEMKEKEKELIKEIEEFQQRMLLHEENRNFFHDMEKHISHALSFINAFEEEEDHKDWIDKLQLCKKLMKVDYERSVIELDNLIEMLQLNF